MKEITSAVALQQQQPGIDRNREKASQARYICMIHPCIHQEQRIRTLRPAKPDSEATTGTTAQFPAPATTDATVMQLESNCEAAPYRWGP